MVEVVDLNADLGERDNELSVEADIPLMREITSASIACGAHAGNPVVMRATIRLALKHGVSIGAHPSYEDRAGFGREEVALSAGEVEEMVSRQIRLLAALAAQEGARMRHVKPHGALYNRAARDASTADAIVRAIVSVDPSLALMGLARSEIMAAATRAGLRSIPEVFADRRYGADGMLLPRGQSDAVITRPEEAIEQAKRLLRDQPHDVRTICVHGDTPGALGIAHGIRLALEAQGVQVKAPAA